jgi:hypothetical protein
MATLAQIQTFAFGEPDLKQRFAAARLQAAWDVFNEATGVANHAARLVWAKKVTSSDADLNKEYLRFLGVPAIQGTKGASTTAASVSAIQTAVDGLVNEYAEVV